MFHRPDIAISWAHDALTVVVRSCSRGGKQRHQLADVPIPSGSIDPLSGKITHEEALRVALERVPLLLRQRGLGVRCVAQAIPSQAAYLHSWEVEGRPRIFSQEELARQTKTLFPGRVDDLIVDCHQVWIEARRVTCVMLVAVNREVVQGYVRLLGSLQSRLELCTTGELARYNSCCALLPDLRRSPVVIFFSRGGYLEVTTWCDGVVRFSKRLRVARDFFVADDESRRLRTSTVRVSRDVDSNQSQGLPYVAEAFSCLTTKELEACQIVACGSQAEWAVQRMPADIESLCAAGRGAGHIGDDAFEGRHKIALRFPDIWGGFEDALGALLAIKPSVRMNRGTSGALSGASNNTGSVALENVTLLSGIQNRIGV